MLDKGLFISFEGIDGSGKSTQIELLRKYLEDKGLDVLLTREPGGTKLGESIRNLILTSEQMLSQNTEALLFAACRSQIVDEVILPAIDAKKIVLCDRYVDSSIAYQCYANGLSMNFIKSINKHSISKAMPNFTIYLRLTPAQSLARIEQRNTDQALDRIEALSDDFKCRVFEGYEDLANKHKTRVFTVDAMSDIEAIHRQIVKMLEKKFDL